MNNKTIRKTELALHLVTAAILLVKAFDVLQRGIYFPAVLLGGIATTILAMLFLCRAIRVHPEEARIMCYFIEAPALLIIAYVLHLQHNDFLPYPFVNASILYAGLGALSSRKYKYKKSLRKKRRLNSGYN